MTFIKSNRFYLGDKVRIIPEMPEHKYHFDCNQEAIIAECPSINGSRYGVILEDGCYSAWYEEDELILLEENTIIRDFVKKHRIEKHYQVYINRQNISY